MKQKRFANAVSLLTAVIISLALGLGAAGCSGSQDLAPGALAAADNPFAELLPAIPPATPPGTAPAAKAAGALQMVPIIGADDFAHSAAAAALGDSMELPSDFGAIQWAIYHNVGDGTPLTGLEVEFTINAGAGAWVAVADYDTMSWELHGIYNSSPAMLDLSGGNYQSAGFDTYFVVIAFDGDFVTVDLSTLTYDDSAPTYSISGTVLENDSIPLAGVEMFLGWSGGGPTTTLTNENGEYTFSELAPDSYSVTPELAGYDFFPSDQNVEIVNADQTGVDFSATAQAVITYTMDIEPLLSTNCVGCHHQGGASGGIRLDTYATASANAAAANSEIQGNGMPPGGPLSADDKALFQAWVDGGTPE